MKLVLKTVFRKIGDLSNISTKLAKNIPSIIFYNLLNFFSQVKIENLKMKIINEYFLHEKSIFKKIISNKTSNFIQNFGLSLIIPKILLISFSRNLFNLIGIIIKEKINNLFKIKRKFFFISGEILIENFYDYFFNPIIFIMNFHILQAKNFIYLTIESSKAKNIFRIIEKNKILFKNFIIKSYENAIEIKMTREFFQEKWEIFLNSCKELQLKGKNYKLKNEFIQFKNSSLKKSYQLITLLKKFDLMENSKDIYKKSIDYLSFCNDDLIKFSNNMSFAINERKSIRKSHYNLKRQL